MLNNLKIRQKLVLEFGIILTLLILISLVGYLNLQNILDQTRKIKTISSKVERKETARFLAANLAYPVFIESNLLIQYLQADDRDEQKNLFKEFEDAGRLFEAKQKDIKDIFTHEDDEDDRKNFQIITDFHQKITDYSLS